MKKQIAVKKGDVKEDSTPKILDAIQNADDCEIIFERGEYHFWDRKAFEKHYFISNNDYGLKKIACALINKKNIVIDGQGSEFIFHGRILPFVIENSENIVIKNLSIDYIRTFYTQGKILEADSDRLVLQIDKKEFPYRIEYGKIIFYSEEWESDYFSAFLEMDKKTMAPAYAIGDHWARSKRFEVKELEEGIVEFKGRMDKIHTVGNYIVISHELRWIPGIFIENGKKIEIENVNVYHAGAMGAVAQNTKDITLKRFNVMLRPDTERLISANADATHFVNCTGTVTITDCIFENQKDDAVNVHGIYTTISKIYSKNEIEVEFNHNQQQGVNIYTPGDRIGFIDRGSLLTFQTAIIKEVCPINKQYMKLVLEDSIPEGVTELCAVEAFEKMPDLVLKNCRAARNRGRGFLITTPGKVLVENNMFCTPGAAVLIEGDANYWFESGGVRDITIRNNTFKDCCYSFWGKAVIQVSPGVNKEQTFDECYHRHIAIESNIFSCFENAVLNICSVDGLMFRNNKIEKTETYMPYIHAEAMIVARSCKNMLIKMNEVSGFEDIDSRID